MWICKSFYISNGGPNYFFFVRCFVLTNENEHRNWCNKKLGIWHQTMWHAWPLRCSIHNVHTCVWSLLRCDSLQNETQIELRCTMCICSVFCVPLKDIRTQMCELEHAFSFNSWLCATPDMNKKEMSKFLKIPMMHITWWRHFDSHTHQCWSTIFSWIVFKKFPESLKLFIIFQYYGYVLWSLLWIEKQHQHACREDWFAVEWV